LQLRVDLIELAEGAVGGLHEDTPCQRDDRQRFVQHLEVGDTLAWSKRRVVGGSDDARVGVQRGVDVVFVPDVVACGEARDTQRKQVVHDGSGDALAACGVLAVG
jgi:hypothetical protein